MKKKYFQSFLKEYGEKRNKKFGGLYEDNVFP